MEMLENFDESLLDVSGRDDEDFILGSQSQTTSGWNRPQGDVKHNIGYNYQVAQPSQQIIGSSSGYSCSTIYDSLPSQTILANETINDYLPKNTNGQSVINETLSQIDPNPQPGHNMSYPYPIETRGHALIHETFLEPITPPQPQNNQNAAYSEDLFSQTQLYTPMLNQMSILDIIPETQPSNVGSDTLINNPVLAFPDTVRGRLNPPTNGRGNDNSVGSSPRSDGLNLSEVTQCADTEPVRDIYPSTVPPSADTEMLSPEPTTEVLECADTEPVSEASPDAKLFSEVDSSVVIKCVGSELNTEAFPPIELQPTPTAPQCADTEPVSETSPDAELSSEVKYLSVAKCGHNEMTGEFPPNELQPTPTAPQCADTEPVSETSPDAELSSEVKYLSVAKCGHNEMTGEFPPNELQPTPTASLCVDTQLLSMDCPSVPPSTEPSTVPQSAEAQCVPISMVVISDSEEEPVVVDAVDDLDKTAPLENEEAVKIDDAMKTAVARDISANVKKAAGGDVVDALSEPKEKTDNKEKPGSEQAQKHLEDGLGDPLAHSSGAGATELQVCDEKMAADNNATEKEGEERKVSLTDSKMPSEADTVESSPTNDNTPNSNANNSAVSSSKNDTATPPNWIEIPIKFLLEGKVRVRLSDKEVLTKVFTKIQPMFSDDGYLAASETSASSGSSVNSHALGLPYRFPIRQLIARSSSESTRESTSPHEADSVRSPLLCDENWENIHLLERECTKLLPHFIETTAPVPKGHVRNFEKKQYRPSQRLLRVTEVGGFLTPVRLEADSQTERQAKQDVGVDAPLDLVPSKKKVKEIKKLFEATGYVSDFMEEGRRSPEVPTIVLNSPKKDDEINHVKKAGKRNIPTEIQTGTPAKKTRGRAKNVNSSLKGKTQKSVENDDSVDEKISFDNGLSNSSGSETGVEVMCKEAPTLIDVSVSSQSEMQRDVTVDVRATPSVKGRGRGKNIVTPARGRRNKAVNEEKQGKNSKTVSMELVTPSESEERSVQATVRQVTPDAKARGRPKRNDTPRPARTVVDLTKLGAMKVREKLDVGDMADVQIMEETVSTKKNYENVNTPATSAAFVTATPPVKGRGRGKNIGTPARGGRRQAKKADDPKIIESSSSNVKDELITKSENEKASRTSPATTAEDKPQENGEGKSKILVNVNQRSKSSELMLEVRMKSSARKRKPSARLKASLESNEEDVAESTPPKKVRLARGVRSSGNDSGTGKDSSNSEAGHSRDSGSAMYVVGHRVFAKWGDGYYYPGILNKEVGAGKWLIKFDDGSGKQVVESHLVPVTALREGNPVDVDMTEHYQSGLIITKEPEENFIVDIAGQEIQVKPSKMRLDMSQVVVIRTDCSVAQFGTPSTSSLQKSAVDLDNIVSGRRRVRPRDIGPFVPSSGRANRSKEADSAPPVGLEYTPCLDIDLSVANSAAKATSASKSAAVGGPARKSRRRILKEPAVSEDLGPVPAEGSTIFANMSFLFCYVKSVGNEGRPARKKPESASDVSMSESEDVHHYETQEKIPFNEEHLRKQLTAGGGKVYERFEDIPPAEYANTRLVTNRPSQSARFLLCLAHGIDAVNHLQIILAVKRGGDFRRMSLPHSGWSVTESRWMERSRKLSKTFHGRHVYIFSKSSDGDADALFLKFWTIILEKTGAEILSENELNYADTIVTDSSVPGHLLEMVEALGAEGPEIVSTRWVIQSLVHGYPIQSKAHQSFHYGYQSASS